MKLIAEINASGRPFQVSYDGEWLSLDSTLVDLDEFRKALDAVAPKQAGSEYQRGSVVGGMAPLQNFYGNAINPNGATMTAGPHPLVTRAPDGTRIGPSPRESMRARPAPEANVVEEDAA
jgi:hypothetical protein